jgi:hypothetical protein
LVDKRYCWCDEKLLVHEKIVVQQGNIGYLKNPINHFPYRSWNHFIEKKQYYAKLQAKQLVEQGIKPNAYHFIIKPTFRFLNQYLFKGGFLDGFPGLANAIGNAYGVLSRYINLRLLIKNMN